MVGKVFKKKILFYVFLVLFLISRAYVLLNPPFYYADPGDTKSGVGYSDVKHDSERYANMWHYGLTPYREHLYEYPPGAIPFVYLPLLVDLKGVGYYYINYRVGIFLLELVLFVAIYASVQRFQVSDLQKTTALLFYIGAGALAKDYWYDGLDLAMMGTFSLAILWRRLKGYRELWKKVVFWSLYWLSVAIKFMTAPLLVPLLWLERKNLVKEIKSFVLGFLLIWSIPLALYRSSLSVIFFFHGVRPIKAESFARFVIETVNLFTKSDYLSDIAPHFPMVGPVSDVVTKVVAIVFPAAIGLFLINSMYDLLKTKSKKVFEDGTMIRWTLIYVFLVFLTGKIFSNPFHIWYVPLIAMLPFRNIKRQLMFVSMAILMLLLDTTPYFRAPHVSLGLFDLVWLRSLVRFIPMFLIVIWLFDKSTVGLTTKKN